MTSRRLFSALSMMILLAAGSAHAGSWSALPQLSPERFGAAGAATPDAFYVMGGMGLAGNIANANAWGSGANAWSDVASLPDARSFAGAAALGHSVLLVGGFEDSGFPSNVVRSFDPGTGWSDVASLPGGQAAAACVALGGAVYLAGGEADYGAYNVQSLRYDPGPNAWTAIPSLPTLRTGPAAAALNGRFYVLGGATGNPVATVEFFDPAANAWGADVSLPEPLWLPAAATFGGRIWVMGGFDAGFNATRHVYSFGSDGWRAEAPLPAPLAQSAAGVLGDMLVVAGGVDSVGQPSGAAYAMSTDVTPPADTLHVAVSINPATLNTSSNGTWLTVLIESEWLIADLDLTTVTLDGVSIDMDGPVSINSDPHLVQVKVDRAHFAQLSFGLHELALVGRTHTGALVTGTALLTVKGNESALKPRLVQRRAASGASEVAVSLLEPAFVKLDVVDIQGRVVEKIEDSQRPAGTYSVTWPGSRSVRSGLYFMRARVAGAMGMTKLVVSR